MVHFIERKELLKIKLVREFLYSTQQGNYQALQQSGFGQTQQAELEAALALRFDALTHTKHSPPPAQPIFHEHILQIDAGNVNGLIRKLPAEILAMLKRFHTTQVFFFTEEKCSWFEQTNSYTSVRRAIRDLVQITGNKNFKEALQVDLPSLERLLKIAFWIGRCNASMPPIYFHPQHEHLIFHICKYGNLHLWSGKTRNKAELTHIFRQTRFHPVSREAERFGQNGRITGRKLLV